MYCDTCTTVLRTYMCTAYCDLVSACTEDTHIFMKILNPSTDCLLMIYDIISRILTCQHVNDDSVANVRR